MNVDRTSLRSRLQPALTKPVTHVKFNDNFLDTEILSPFDFCCARPNRFCNGPECKHARILLTWTKVDAAVYQYVAVWNFMAFALRAEGLWKLYESGESVIQAVQDVSLIKQGSMVAIMGPSGCENHATQRPFGIDEPNSGTVMINGENLTGRAMTNAHGYVESTWDLFSKNSIFRS